MCDNFCYECGSGDDGSTQSKIELQLDEILRKVVLRAIPEHIVRLEGDIQKLHVKLHERDGELREALRPDEELRRQLNEMTVYASNTDAIKEEVAALQEALKDSNGRISVREEEILFLNGELKGAERSAVKRAEAHQEEKANLLAQNNDLKLWVEGAIKKFGELDKRLRMGGEYRAIYELHKEIDRLKVKLSNCHHWSDPRVWVTTQGAMELIHREAGGCDCTNSE